MLRPFLANFASLREKSNSSDSPVGGLVSATGSRVADLFDRLSVAHACILCFVARFGFMLTPWAQKSPDDSNYGALSEIFLSGEWSRRSTFLEPLYPLFLTVARWMTGDRFQLVMLAQIALATLGCWGLYRLAIQLSGEHRIALSASLIYAVFFPSTRLRASFEFLLMFYAAAALASAVAQASSLPSQSNPVSPPP